MRQFFEAITRFNKLCIEARELDPNELVKRRFRKEYANNRGSLMQKQLGNLMHPAEPAFTSKAAREKKEQIPLFNLKPRVEHIGESDEELRHLERVANSGSDEDKRKYYSALQRQNSDKFKQHAEELSHNFITAQKAHYDASDRFRETRGNRYSNVDDKEKSNNNLMKASKAHTEARNKLFDFAKHMNTINGTQHHPGHYLVRGKVDSPSHLTALARLHSLRNINIRTTNHREKEPTQRFRAQEMQDRSPPFGFPGMHHFVRHVHHHYGVMPKTHLSDGFTRVVSFELPNQQKHES
jgi:hypothetical protein